MPPFTPVQLAEAILQLQLLDGEPRDRLLALAASHRDARELAQDLLRRDWLTAYQINQLFLGRGADLAFGPYVYLERLGEGGMGQVFKARQRSLGRVVALKVIRRECLSNAKVIKRFEREMQALGQMRHPNIVHAFDADHVDGVCYIAMEYIDGIDLARLVKQSGPLPVTQACDYIRQAALGLGHAAEQGLVHRDIKPANLFLTRPGETRASAIMARAKETGVQPRPSGLASRPVSQASGVVPLPASDLPWGLIKILDMGLARWTDVDNDRTRLTQLGAVMGTPDYIAPEQTRNSSACDIRADLYSLGCTFYFLLSGQPPFPNGTLTERLLHHQLDQAEPVDEARRRRLLDPDWVKAHGRPSSAETHVPEAVSAILRELMAKKPEDRYQTPGELAAALAEFLKEARCGGREPKRQKRATPKPLNRRAADPSSRQGKPPAVGPSAVGPPAVEPPAAEPAPSERNEATEIPRRRGRRRLALVSLGVALICGMLLAAMSTHYPQASPPLLKLSAEDAGARGLEELRTKVRANKGDGAELRREIVGFRAAHFNDALAREADRLLTELPSPLDRLDRSKIDKLQKFEWQPREVVAVLGAWKIASDSKPWRTLAFAPDASWLVAGGEETPLRAWSTGGPLFPLKLGGAPARSTLIAVSPDGGQFATAGSDGVLRLWDVTARTQRAFERHPRPVVGLAYHPAGDRLATACGDGKIRLWDIATGKRLHVWEAGADVAALAFTPNGRDLFWALRTGNLCCADPQRPETAPRRFPHKRGALRRLAFDRDGQRLIGVGADGSVTQWVWNGAGLREVASVKGHDKGAHDIAFAPDGQTFVTVGEDGFVKHWDAATHRPQRSWELRWPVLGVAFAADGRHFATANSNGTIYIFRLESTTALARK